MFHSTRLKLTVWYLLIIMAISISFSAFIYFGATREFDRALRVENYRMVHPDTRLRIFQIAPWDQDIVTLPPLSDPQIIESTKIRVLEGLFMVNLIILFFSTIAGYFLAGRTLKPIKNMLDEQNRFITDASHELNTPLTSLKTAIEVNLRDKVLSLKKAKDVLKSNLDDVNNLQFLSAELIKLTQYQDQNINLQLGKVLLKDVIEEAIEKVRVLAKKRNIKITLNSPRIAVAGDRRSLVELFTILLDNAIKYSPDKRSVSVIVEKIDSKAQISIKDQGVGIDKKDIPYIFDRFYRTDKSRAKQETGGYGLGLSIAKRIVALHDGDIEVESEVGKGSVFTVSLPRS